MFQTPMHAPTVNIFRVIALLATAVMLGLGGLDMMALPPEQIQSAAARMSALPVLATQVAMQSDVDGTTLAARACRMQLHLFSLLGLVFSLALWLRTSPHRQRRSWLDAVLLAAQVLIAVVLEPWTEPGLVYLVAAELALVLPSRAAFMCLIAQVVLTDVSSVPLLLYGGDGHPQCNVAGILPPPAIVVAGMGWLEGMAFQGFAFCVGYFASAEMRGRTLLASAHAELVSAQLLLTDAVRTAERARIAHNLDGILGQHVCTLNAQLALATHETGAHAGEALTSAHELAQRLQTELQVVVSADRGPRAIDLRQALQTLCGGIPAPRITLSFDAEFEIGSPLLAHTIFRCVQEAVSNAVRHSGASVMRISLSSMHEGVAVCISDNGRGTRQGEARQVQAEGGNGLLGLRERIAEHGGSLLAGQPPGGGFSLRIWLPQAGVLQ